MVFFKKTYLRRWFKEYFSDSDEKPNIPLHVKLDFYSGFDVIEDSIENIREYYHFQNPLILIGPNVDKVKYKKRNLGNYLKKTLEEICDGNVNKSFFKEPQVSYKGIKELKDNLKEKEIEYDTIISVGGGKIIDAGKCLSNKKCNVFTIPTIISNDAFNSPFASVFVDGEKQTISVEGPKSSICEYQIIMDSPDLNAGFGDAIAKYSSSYDWRLAGEKDYVKYKYRESFRKVLSELSEMLIYSVDSLPKKNGKIEINKQFVDLLIFNLTYSGTCMYAAESTIPASGSEHKFSHAIDELGYGKSHGLQCGMGTILTSYLQGRNWKDVKNSMELMDGYINFEDLNLGKKEAFEVIEKMFEIKPERYTILNKLQEDKGNLRAIRYAKSAAKKIGIL